MEIGSAWMVRPGQSKRTMMAKDIILRMCKYNSSNHCHSRFWVQKVFWEPNKGGTDSCQSAKMDKGQTSSLDSDKSTVEEFSHHPNTVTSQIRYWTWSEVLRATYFVQREEVTGIDVAWIESRSVSSVFFHRKLSLRIQLTSAVTAPIVQGPVTPDSVALSLFDVAF